MFRPVTAGEYAQPQEDTPLLFMFIFWNCFYIVHSLPAPDSKKEGIDTRDLFIKTPHSDILTPS